MENAINNIIVILLIITAFFCITELWIVQKDTAITRKDVAAIKSYIDRWEEIESSVDYCNQQ